MIKIKLVVTNFTDIENVTIFLNNWIVTSYWTWNKEYSVIPERIK